MHYSFNYFIDPGREKIKFEEIRDICKELIFDKLPTLPDHPDDIPKAIHLRIPEHIPILHPSLTSKVVSGLRSYYAFEKLPESYFDKKRELPYLPSDLIDDYKDWFPLTDRSQLRDLGHKISELQKTYTVKSKLPDTYFKLPPVKKDFYTTIEICPAILPTSSLL